MITLMSISDYNAVLKLGKYLHNNFDILYEYDSLVNNIDKTYIINNDNIIIGFIHIKELIDEIDIIDIVIDRKFRKLGYASSLLEYIIKMYVDKKIILEVASNNIEAIKLYTKYNFKQIGVRKKYYDGNDAIVMERS